VKTQLDALGRYDVVGMSDVRAILGIAAQRQLAGCKSSDTQCMAQIAGALGARRLISGTVSRIGHSLILNLVFLDAKAAASVGRVARRVRAKGGVEPLLDVVGPAVAELVARDHLPGLATAGKPGPEHRTPAHSAAARPTLARATPPSGETVADASSPPDDPGATPSIAPALPAGPSTPLGLTLGLRTEALVPAPGFALGVSGVYQPGLLGAGATILLRPLALRLEGRVRAFQSGPVEIDAGLGLTAFTTGLAARLFAGVSFRLGSVVLGADLAYEPPLVGPIVPWDVLVGAHVGWRL